MILGKLKWIVVALAIVLAIVLALSVTLICTKHTHAFTDAHATATEHYLVCPSDEAIDESTRGGHTRKYAYDAEGHWRYCTDILAEGQRCIWMGAKEEHSFTNGVCSVCGYHR